MPVMTVFSRKVYEKLGDDVGSELADWCNRVEATYRADLREMNELNFARFDAKLEQRVSELRADMHSELAKLRVELITWSFVFFATAALAVIGLR